MKASVSEIRTAHAGYVDCKKRGSKSLNSELHNEAQPTSIDVDRDEIKRNGSGQVITYEAIVTLSVSYRRKNLLISSPPERDWRV